VNRLLARDSIMQSSLEKVRFQVFSLFRFQGTKKTKHKIAIQEERFIAYTTNNVRSKTAL